MIETTSQLDEYRSALINHPLYNAMNSIDAIQRFMETHVFAVWDFMSLLKRLQLDLTCATIPWTPVGNPVTRRLINEIVFGEESDVDQNGNATSHFELYIKAMEDIGADTSAIKSFIQQLEQGETGPSVPRRRRGLGRESLPSMRRRTFVLTSARLELGYVAAEPTRGPRDAVAAPRRRPMRHATRRAAPAREYLVGMMYTPSPPPPP